MSSTKSKVTRASQSSSPAHVSHVAHPSSPSPDAVGVVAATPVTPVTPADVTTQAAQAVAALRTLSATLPIDDALPPKDLLAAKVSNRVPLKAMAVAADILEAAPGQFPHFDAHDARSSIAYEQAMGPVANSARTLADRIEKSILKRRSKNATQTLALYGTLKAVSRLPASETTRGQVKQLTKLLKTYRKPRAEKVTQKELGVVAKGMRKEKVAKVKAAKAAVASELAAVAANVAGIAPPPPAASPAPAAPPPPAAPPVTKAP